MTPRSILGLSPYVGSGVGLALLVEAAWYWYALEGWSAPSTSAAYRDPLGAALIGALLLALAATLAGGRSLAGRGTMAVSADATAVLVFGLLTLVTWGLTTLGVTTNLPDSDFPQAARDMPLFVTSFGVAFCAGLLMMLDRITRRSV